MAEDSGFFPSDLVQDDAEGMAWFVGILIALAESGWSVVTPDGAVIVMVQVHFP